MVSQVIPKKSKQWIFVKVFNFAREINMVLKNCSACKLYKGTHLNFPLPPWLGKYNNQKVYVQQQFSILVTLAWCENGTILL